MTETYSLASLAADANSAGLVKSLTLPDSAARPGSQQNAMQNGSQVYVKGPDGGFAWYTFDAERSTLATPVLKRVGP